MSSAASPASVSAWQRWELSALGEQLQGMAATPDPLSNLPTVEQLERMHDDARNEGLAAGFAEGRAAGLAEGHAAAARDVEHLRTLIESFAQQLAIADQAIAHEALLLSLDVSKAMLKRALAIKPDFVIDIVREAIEYLPLVQQPALLHLNPDDAVLVRARLGDEIAGGGWRIVEDIQVARGGCRVDTASNQIDATAETRWQRIAAALGLDNAWLG